MKDLGKMYKKTMNKQFNKNKRELHCKIRDLKSKNPKEYWSIVNSDGKKNQSDTSSNAIKDVLQSISRNLATNKKPASDEVFVCRCNGDFTVEEIRVCIHKIANNKACSPDQTFNEYLKYAADIMMPVQLNYLILKTGVFLEAWTTSIIIPVYKNKRSKEDPGNYRGITLLSCFGNLFTSVISRRLTQYLEDHDLIGEEQAGFRGGYV